MDFFYLRKVFSRYWKKPCVFASAKLKNPTVDKIRRVSLWVCGSNLYLFFALHPKTQSVYRTDGPLRYITRFKAIGVKMVVAMTTMTIGGNIAASISPSA